MCSHYNCIRLSATLTSRLVLSLRHMDARRLDRTQSSTSCPSAALSNWKVGCVTLELTANTTEEIRVRVEGILESRRISSGSDVCRFSEDEICGADVGLRGGNLTAMTC